MRQASHAQNVAAQQEAVIHNVRELKTGSWQYIVADPSTSHAIIIDPVLDYDAATAKITTQTAGSLLSIVEQKGYTVQMILETHAHADHLTAANYLRQKLAQSQGHAPPVGIGKRIVEVQKFWAARYNIPAEEYDNVFDKLLDDDETFSIGSLTGVAMHLPGHTPDHMGYMIGGGSSIRSAHYNNDN
jgi:glyoxylase-like metal-dependent hydrolase (beta-lactamase superfamily II)